MKKSKFIYLVLILLLTSCHPGIKECEKALKDEFHNSIHIININQINGVESERGGFMVYDVYFSSAFEFTKDYSFESPMFGTLSLYKKGTRFEVEDAIATFVKTDNGWVCHSITFDVLRALSGTSEEKKIQKIPRNDTDVVDDYYKIKLPEQFECTPYSNPISQSYTDGIHTFCIYPWGHDGIDSVSLVDAAEKKFDREIKFKKTIDGLLWGSGKTSDNIYHYIILIPSQLLEIQVFSAKNDKIFSLYSEWLLGQVRKADEKRTNILLTRSDGQTCSN